MGLYNWRNKLLLDLPMRAADHDPVNTLSVNRGRAGTTLDAVFGAGAATPTKLDYRRGYNFDGGDDMQCSAGYSISSGLVSMLMTVRPTDLDVAAVSAFFCWETGATVDVCVFLYVLASDQLRFYCGGNLATNAATFTGMANLGFSDGPVSTICGVHDGTDTILYVNGVARATATAPLSPPGTSHSMRVMERGGGGSNAVGDVHHVGMADFALSPAQCSMYHRIMMARLHQI